MRKPNWLGNYKTPEFILSSSKEKLRISQEGTIDSHVLGMRELRKFQRAQARGKNHENLFMVKKRFC